MRLILPILLALVIAPFAVGQPPGGAVAPPGSAPGRAELTAMAAPAPVPALRYELLPPGRDKVPGNAALGYLKAVALQPPWPRDPDAARKQSETTAKWDEARFDQLPAGEVEEFLTAYRDMLRTADAAARMDRCDWQHRAAGPEAISGTLTLVQGHRELARWLSLRAKLELKQDRPADAVRTLQTGFRLGKDVGEGGTLIQMLIGYAITTRMVGRAEDVIRHPDGPNLYWALTTLPRPFIDPRPGLDGEARFTASFLPWLRELRAGPVSEEQARRAFRETLRMMSGVLKDAPEGEGDLAKLIGNIGRTAGLALPGKQAKKDLLARGWKEKDVAAMPDAQAVLLMTAATHREMWDDQVKLFHLPYPVAVEGMAKVRKRAEVLRVTRQEYPLIAVFSLLYPTVEKVHAAYVRVDRRLAQLRAVEAVRLHAAMNGSVPKSLAEVTAVPVPDDPATGKPFEYKADGGTFTLSAPPPKGEAANPSNAFEYVVTVRKR
ncbi:MAG TPA: hypothetical protein VFG68_17885 [Fimbriiglobus sp.]|nr:hypothetical protein [Fimbriiglobus sp.]